MLDLFQRYLDFQYFKAHILDLKKNQLFASMSLNIITVFLALEMCFS